jgi:3-mercaptopyruvate sulfurtransferase SseA
MLHAFKAILTGNRLEWLDETPPTSDRPLEVRVTILEPEPNIETISCGQKMAEALEKLAALNTFAGVNPVAWQRDIRQDRSLPHLKG